LKTPASSAARKRTIPDGRVCVAKAIFYVNDAFSAAHRAHASTEGLAHVLARLCWPFDGS
jgi:3-phosphoglycerate kinase